MPVPQAADEAFAAGAAFIEGEFLPVGLPHLPVRLTFGVRAVAARAGVGIDLPTQSQLLRVVGTGSAARHGHEIGVANTCHDGRQDPRATQAT